MRRYIVGLKEDNLEPASATPIEAFKHACIKKFGAKKFEEVPLEIVGDEMSLIGLGLLMISCSPQIAIQLESLVNFIEPESDKYSGR